MFVNLAPQALIVLNGHVLKTAVVPELAILQMDCVYAKMAEMAWIVQNSIALEMVFAQTKEYVKVNLDPVFALKDLKEICVKKYHVLVENYHVMVMGYVITLQDFVIVTKVFKELVV